MKSDVWFWNLRASMKAPLAAKMARLLKSAGADKAAQDGDLTALKVHFGEGGNSRFISPLWYKPVIEFYAKLGARPFLTDANTLYAGNRGNSVAHTLQAAAHGFDANLLGAPVVIADGLKSQNEAVLPVKGKYNREAYIAGDIAAADALVTLSHFKGHILAGYGGALKNVGMGCATRRGKMQQHKSLGPILHEDKCAGCGSCLEVCGPGALSLSAEGKIQVDRAVCVGCGACFHACAKGGLEIDWKIDIGEFLARMMEYAAAVLLNRRKPAFHVSFAVQITPDCDCASWSDAPLCPDLGVFASFDPVALDQACLDMVTAAPALYPSQLPEGLAPGADKFRAVNRSVPEDYGLDYAVSLGLGSRDYKLHAIK